jgi:hypothetical protein
MAIHLGSLIKYYCKQSNIKVEQLAKDLGVTTDAIYKMFKTSNLKIETVLKVSLSLKHDFFKHYLEQLQPNVYHKAVELEKENLEIKAELQTLRIETEIYKKLLKLSEPEK